MVKSKAKKKEIEAVKVNGKAKFDKNGKLISAKEVVKAKVEPVVKKPEPPKPKKVVKQSSKMISADDFLKGIESLGLTNSTDKYGLTTIKDGKQVLTYIQDTKYGMSYYNRTNGTWRSEKLMTVVELQNKIAQVTKQIEAKDKIRNSLIPYYHCDFGGSDCFVTSDKDEMMEHIKEKHL